MHVKCHFIHKEAWEKKVVEIVQFGMLMGGEEPGESSSWCVSHCHLNCRLLNKFNEIINFIILLVMITIERWQIMINIWLVIVLIKVMLY